MMSSLARPLLSTLIAASACLGAVTATTAHAATKPADDAATRYPIVLVHGLFGFDRILGVVDYWHQIPAELRKGGATVLVAQVSAVNDNDVRGEQLIKQLQQWSASKGYKKFNLIGHSQGGPTARYAAGVAPQLVASVTSMASPHTIPETGRDDLVGQLLTNYASTVGFIGKSIDWLSGNAKLPQDPAALKAWSENTAAFNARFPAGQPANYCGEGLEKASNGIYYYSATGNKAKTNAWDISDLALTDAGEPSDGLVLVCSAYWGKALRMDYPWNHLDEVNQVLGLIGKGAPDPVGFYRQQAGRLKAKGL